MPIFLALLFAGLALASLYVPYKEPDSREAGTLFTEVFQGLFNGGDLSALLLGTLLMVGMFLPAVGVLLGSGRGSLTRSLLRVVGVGTLLESLALGGGIGMSLSILSVSGGVLEYNMFAWIIPSTYAIAGLLMLFTPVPQR